MALFEIVYPNGLVETEEAATEYQAAINAIRSDIDFKYQLHNEEPTLEDVPDIEVVNLTTGTTTKIDGELLFSLIYLSNHCPNEIPEEEEEGQWQNAEEWQLG